MASLLVFFLLPFRYFFFLIFFSRTKMISNPSKPWVDTQNRNCKHRCRPIKQSWNTHGINNYILISFGEIIRFTAANFFVFFILPWCKKDHIRTEIFKNLCKKANDPRHGHGLLYHVEIEGRGFCSKWPSTSVRLASWKSWV